MHVRITALIALIAIACVIGGSAEVRAGGGCHGEVEAKFSDAATTNVAASQCSFQPTVARVDVGQEVTFHNKDVALHTFTGVLGSWGNYREYQEGQSAAYSFDKAGVYPYFCELHPGMVGTIVVGDGSAASETVTGVSAVSAVSGGQPAEPEAIAAEITQTGNGSSVEIIAGTAVLGAIIGMIALAPIAVRRFRPRA
jgi:plastocyanin